MLEHLHRRTNKLNKIMRKIEATHNKILTEQQQQINKIHQHTQEMVYYYRKINLRERPDHLKPKSFENEHEIDVEIQKQDENREKLNATLRLQKAAV